MSDSKSGKNEKGEADCKDEVSEPKWKCPPVRNVTHPLRYYEFTPDELRALEECDRESFYRRCLPFSTLFAALTYAGIKTGHVARHPHFGAMPRVALAALAGHWLGRVCYVQRCERRLRELPATSHLGNTMRGYHDDRNSRTNTNK